MQWRNSIRHNPLNQLYDEARLPGEIRRSLNFMLLGNIFGTACGLICGGSTTAMVGLANSLGASDLIFGILSAIPQAAALLQIPFSMLVNRTHKRKKYLLTWGLLSRFLWILFGFIPLVFPVGASQLAIWTMVFLLGVISCSGSMINVCWFPWLSDLCPIGIRGRWLSIRETVLAAVNVSLGLVVASLLDHLPPQNKYLVIFLIGGAVGMMDMICFGFCRECYSAPSKKLGITEIFSDVWKNVPFRRFLIMWTVWAFTGNMAAPYFTPYSMNVMGLNFTQIMIFATISSSIATMVAVPRWGRLMDRFGSRSVMEVACVGFSLAPLFYLFSAPGNIWPTLLYSVLGGAFCCGGTLVANSMQLSCSPDDKRPAYVAIFSCVTSLAGTAVGTLVGGELLELMNGANLFTGYFDRYKALILLTVILRLAGVLLLTPGLTNDRDGTAGDVIRSMFVRKKLRGGRH